VRWLLVAVFAVGCGLPPIDIDESKLIAPPPGAAEAIARVEADFGVTAPPVYWYGPSEVSCGGGYGFTYKGRCSGGMQGSNGILLIYPYDGAPMHETAIVHEMAHVDIGDDDHVTPGVWGDHGHDNYVAGTRVGDGNAALAANGL
jgi:hypothetical protein